MYEKQTWTTGEVITKAKLDHIENGLEKIGNRLVLEPTTVTVDGVEYESFYPSGDTPVPSSIILADNITVSDLMDGFLIKIPVDGASPMYYVGLSFGQGVVQTCNQAAEAGIAVTADVSAIVCTDLDGDSYAILPTTTQFKTVVAK